MFTNLITPNGHVDQNIRLYLRLGWLVVAALLWTTLKPTIQPSLMEILTALPELFQHGLIEAVQSSLWTNIKALVLSTLIALPLAYCSRIPLVEPVARAVSQLRFLSPTIFFLLLLFWLRDANKVKVWMLVMAEVFFLATTMINAVQNIPQDSFDEARVLRMDAWTSMWYVTVRGTLDAALEAIRDNAAIGWSMLTMVESIVRSQGGVGIMILNQERGMHFEIIYGIALAVLVVGLTQDWLLRELRRQLCPHTTL
jgi:NitT/TauT family transport system permease protein